MVSNLLRVGDVRHVGTTCNKFDEVVNLVTRCWNKQCERILTALTVAYTVSALPFTTKLQVKPGRTGSVAGWVTICAESQTWDSRE